MLDQTMSSQRYQITQQLPPSKFGSRKKSDTGWWAVARDPQSTPKTDQSSDALHSHHHSDSHQSFDTVTCSGGPKTNTESGVITEDKRVDGIEGGHLGSVAKAWLSSLRYEVYLFTKAPTTDPVDVRPLCLSHHLIQFPASSISFSFALFCGLTQTSELPSLYVIHQVCRFIDST